MYSRLQSGIILRVYLGVGCLLNIINICFVFNQGKKIGQKIIALALLIFNKTYKQKAALQMVDLYS